MIAATPEGLVQHWYYRDSSHPKLSLFRTPVCRYANVLRIGSFAFGHSCLSGHG